MEPTTGLKVIGASFGRTATMSTYTALNMLGYRTYHMFETFANDRKGRGDLMLWRKMNDGTATSEDIDRIYDGYDAAVDFFTCSFVKELLAKYPDAKVHHESFYVFARLNKVIQVIYNKRDPEKWRQSALETIYAFHAFFHDNGFFGRYCYFWNRLFGMTKNIEFMSDAIWGRHFFNGEPLKTFYGDEGKKLVARKCAEWEAYVRSVVPPNQLLVVDVDKGGLTWEPICQFLGKPVPDAPFPNVNDSKEFKARSKPVKFIMLIAPTIGTLSVVGALVGAAYWLNKSLNR